MTANEKSIAWESADGSVWVLDTKRAYFVMRAGPVCSESESAYSHDDDGRTLAIARAAYLAKRESRHAVRER